MRLKPAFSTLCAALLPWPRTRRLKNQSTEGVSDEGAGLINTIGRLLTPTELHGLGDPSRFSRCACSIAVVLTKPLAFSGAHWTLKSVM